jgi:hypothetical protein
MAIVPCHTRVIIPVKENDERFIRIQEIIEEKRNMLIEKQKKLRFISRQNQFLEVVKNDYENIYSYVVQQKRDQIRALEVLDEYMKQLTLYGKLTKHNIEDAKQEQSKILKELSLIKENLDSIITDTHDIVSKQQNYLFIN